MSNALIDFQSAPFNGPFSGFSLLIDNIKAVPYEGLWVPSYFLKAAQIELEGSQSTLGVDLYGTNLDSVGNANQYAITIGGSQVQNDIMTLTFKNPNLAAAEAVHYTIGAGETTTTVAAALAAAINADTILQGLGFVATSASAVITVSYPSQPANVPQQSNPNFPSSPGLPNATTIAGSSTGSETLTVACGTNGTKIGSTLSAFGLTALTMPLRYVKARLTTLTGTNAFVNAALQGNG